jgi:hypothetical protein
MKAAPETGRFFLKLLEPSPLNPTHRNALQLNEIISLLKSALKLIRGAELGLKREQLVIVELQL